VAQCDLDGIRDVISAGHGSQERGATGAWTGVTHTEEF
jgi:N-acetylmuramoyl-L-alanine amidase